MICIDPIKGKLVRSVTLPSSQITSCCFGGPDYSVLYVTSGAQGRPPHEMNSYPDSGKTFAITGLGIKGFPPNNFKL